MGSDWGHGESETRADVAGLIDEMWEWAASLPWWQQHALARLAAGVIVGSAQYQTLAAQLLGDPPKPPRGGWLGAAPGWSLAAGQQVRLLAARDLANVNALAAGRRLTFAATASPSSTATTAAASPDASG